VAYQVFRAGATVAAVLAAGQPVLAGGFLQGHYSMLAAHGNAALILAAALLVALSGAVLMWRPGRGSGRPAVLCAVALLLCVVQIGLGFTRELIIHVPLGVILVVLVIQIAVLSWRMPLVKRDVAAPRRAAETAVDA
jgi:hypothetical protein